LRVFGQPIGEMVFWEDSEPCSFLSCGSDELGGFGEILCWLEGLRSCQGGVLIAEG